MGTDREPPLCFPGCFSGAPHRPEPPSPPHAGVGRGMRKGGATGTAEGVPSPPVPAPTRKESEPGNQGTCKLQALQPPPAEQGWGTPACPGALSPLLIPGAGTRLGQQCSSSGNVKSWVRCGCQQQGHPLHVPPCPPPTPHHSPPAPEHVRSRVHEDGAHFVHTGFLQVVAGAAELMAAALEVLLLEDGNLGESRDLRGGHAMRQAHTVPRHRLSAAPCLLHPTPPNLHFSGF